MMLPWNSLRRERAQGAEMVPRNLKDGGRNRAKCVRGVVIKAWRIITTCPEQDRQHVRREPPGLSVLAYPDASDS